MTNREFFTAIINSSVSDELVAHATAELEKLDAKNAKRKNTISKTQRENEPIKASIVEHLTANGASVASAIATALGITTQKASSLCGVLVKEGVLAVEDVKVKGKGTVKQYAIID